MTLHEAGKFCRLALQCNPTILELLWLEGYTVITGPGEDLVNTRGAFLSAKRIRNAYYGYATQQFARIRSRGDNSFSADTRNRTAKHARHLWRLLHQGIELYKTGELRPRLDLLPTEAAFDFGDRVAEGDLDLAQAVLDCATIEWDNCHCAVPQQPDEDRVTNWLRNVRREFL